MKRSRLQRATLFTAPAFLAAAAGCGGIAGHMAGPANDTFAISTSTTSVNTNGQAKLRAGLTTGGPAAVSWTIVRGENDPSIGQGTIDERGNYLPPASITRDSVEVEVEAQLRSDPTKVASEVIRVTPGFLQPLTPENSALAAGGTVQIAAQLAEVGSGTVEWELATSSTGGRRLSSTYGTLTQQSCQHNAQNYTTCTVVYTAPAAMPPSRTNIYVVGTITGTETSAPVHVLLNGAGVNSTPLINQAAQTALVQMGSSGGNTSDADTTRNDAGSAYVNDCCGGTLGALVQDNSGNQYILSNNHVLAESDQAGLGDTIVQPGLIDSNCDQNAGRAVGALRYTAPLANPQTNVDAALATVSAGSVDPSGAILQFGNPGAGANSSIGAAAPARGTGQPITAASFNPNSPPLHVAKSGRTTGLTCSSIDAIHLSILVDYYKDCAETQPYSSKVFTNQIGIGGDGFSDSGDSGALVVDAATAEPVGLFFAGGTDDAGRGLSVANPIQDVLGELGAQAGTQLSIVGGPQHPVSCLNYDAAAIGIPAGRGPSETQMKRAEAVARKSGPALVNPALGILAVTAGNSADNPGEAAILVYTDKAKENVAVPQTIGGLRTIVIPTDAASEANGTAPKSPAVSAGIRLPENVLQPAIGVQQSYARRLMSDPAIFGVGVGQSHDDPAQAALLVLVDMSKTPRYAPTLLGGLRVRYVYLHRFHVTRSKHAGSVHPSGCALKPVSVEKSSQQEFDPDRIEPINLK